MCQGSKVSGCAQGTLLVNHREDIVIEHVDEPLKGDQLNAGMAVGQRLGFQQEHQFHYLRTDLFAGAAGMGHYQVVLKLGQVLFWNCNIVQGPESRGYAVYGTADVFHLPVQVLAALDYSLNCLRGQFQGHFLVDNFLYSLKREMLF